MHNYRPDFEIMPLQLLPGAVDHIGLLFAALMLALKNRGRLACLLMAPIWAFVAMVFFIQHYAQLNGAGNDVGYAFLAQAILLLWLALSGRVTKIK